MPAPEFPPDKSITYVRRSTDDSILVIKRMRTNSGEHRIVRMLSSTPLRTSAENPVVPTIDHYSDENDGFTYIVMPRLFPVRLCRFETIPDIYEFGIQVLKGLVFLHHLGISHGQIRKSHFLVDHPDSRSKFPKYYFTDFGAAIHSETPLRRSERFINDRFAADVYDAGVMLSHLLDDNSFPIPDAISEMVQHGSGSRLTAEEILEHWYLFSDLPLFFEHFEPMRSMVFWGSCSTWLFKYMLGITLVMIYPQLHLINVFRIWWVLEVVIECAGHVVSAIEGFFTSVLVSKVAVMALLWSITAAILG